MCFFCVCTLSQDVLGNLQQHLVVHCGDVDGCCTCPLNHDSPLKFDLSCRHKQRPKPF